LQAQFPERDWILSRILWLGGLEPRKNRYGAVDTLRRFIYLHGTPDTVTLGVANSKGCIRLHNAELIHLFEQVKVGTRVFIGE
jgi:lipoprotein-anchoring transpeptidase ErfK/SrfK